jgi:hypothetical protein
VDYGPVVFPSHIVKVFHVKIVCLVLVVFGYIFSAYILLYFIVSYRFTQRGSFVYCCFSQQFPHKAPRKRRFPLVEELYLRDPFMIITFKPTKRGKKSLL